MLKYRGRLSLREAETLDTNSVKYKVLPDEEILTDMEKIR